MSAQWDGIRWVSACKANIGSRPTHGAGKIRSHKKGSMVLGVGPEYRLDNYHLTQARVNLMQLLDFIGPAKVVACVRRTRR